MILNEKALMGAPCGMTFRDRDDKLKIEYPSVDCSLDCKYCGWNPKEVERRMATGKVVEKNGLKTLHFDRA